MALVSIVQIWTSLPEIVISPDATVTYKRLDQFWKHPDILRHFKFPLNFVLKHNFGLKPKLITRF